MRRLIPSAMVVLIGVLPVAAHAQMMPMPTPAPPVIQIEKTSGSYRTMAIGIGAIAGVVIFNVATGGLGTVPLLAALGESGAAAGATGGATAAVAEAGALTANTVAQSRVFAVTSAVVGGWIGNWYATR